MDMFYYRRRGMIAATAAALLCAGVPGAATPARAADDAAAIAPIRQLIGGLEQVMKAGMGAPFSQRYAMLAPIIDRTFDLTAILRESVGPTWASLPASQQAMLTEAFRRYTVATYVNGFDSSDGTRFEVSPHTRAVGNQQVVQTKIIPRSGDSHELDYVMRDEGSGWKAVDVLADGSISRVAVQRSDFRRLLAQGGADALVASLRSKSADLSDGQS
ncbi:MAG TPA: ABC transporter substrate-binding protein [Rhodopila sp.]